ncbi:MAG: pyruvate kinase, partial [Chloroflexota bacterium]|nr:pyruvate kinase [Chloroflexota bacterium]
VMLSGETAVGKYPVQTVRTMAKIVAETESALQYSNMLIDKSRQVTAHTDDAISFAACSISHQLNASCIVAYTASGSTALRVSRCRPKAPILALTPHASVARRLILSWGVEPYVTNEPSNIDVMFNNAAQLASKTGIAKTGDRVVITAGIPMGKQGSTNVVKVQPVE